MIITTKSECNISGLSAAELSVIRVAADLLSNDHMYLVYRKAAKRLLEILPSYSGYNDDDVEAAFKENVKRI